MAKRTTKSTNSTAHSRTAGTKRPVKGGASPTRSVGKAAKMQHPAKKRGQSPLDKAQRLVDKAITSSRPERQFELAQQALEMSQDCADAYTLLARLLVDRRQAKTLLQQGLQAAERALGAEAITQLTGCFWRAPETRPYMRVRLALADCLWDLGAPEEAVAHLQDLLRLNPDDDQGIHFSLASHLLELGRDAEFDKLVGQYPDSNTFFEFSKLLREFRRSGDSAAARQQLNRAIKHNRFVIPLLLGLEELPGHPPEMFSKKSPDEAALYVGDLGLAWPQTPGALTWLRKMAETLDEKKSKSVAKTGSSPKKGLTKIRQADDAVWQASLTCLPTWTREGYRMIRPWSLLVVDASVGKIVGQQLFVDHPDADILFETLARFCHQPQFGKPQRPQKIHVRRGPIWNKLRSPLRDAGIACVFKDELPEVDEGVRDLETMMRQDQPPGIVDIDGFRDSQGGSFYKAAASYFKATPWRYVAGDSIIRVDSPQFGEFGPGHWHALVLGRDGQAYGLGLYSEICDVQALAGGCCSSDGERLEGISLSVVFGEAWEVPINDFDAAREQRWTLAGPEAYPFVMCAEGEHELRHSSAAELQLLEACLIAIPDFLKRCPPASAGEPESKFATSAAQLKLTLSWSDDLAGHCQSECATDGDCDSHGCDSHDDGCGHHHH